jgi:hypothetical protein
MTLKVEAGKRADTRSALLTYFEIDRYSTAFTMSSITFFASPNTIMVLSM